MDKYKGITGRDQLVTDLLYNYKNKKAKSVILIHAGDGQGKTYVINSLMDNLYNSKENIKIYQNKEGEFVQYGHSLKTKALSSIDISIGTPVFSLGMGFGWESQHSYYNKIKNILSKHITKNVLFCVKDISLSSDCVRTFVTLVIENITELELKFKKKIYFLITDTTNIYENVIYKFHVSKEIIDLPNYSVKDIEPFFERKNRLYRVSDEDVKKIYELSNGNLHIADFLYEEVLIQGNDFLSTLEDIVKNKIALIKMRSEKSDLSGKEIENVIFSASLAIKKFSAGFLTEVTEKKLSDVSSGLEIAKKEALLDQDMQKYYSFLSTDIQKYIADITVENCDNWLVSYYNYYSKYEQDEYYLRAYYLLKYQKKLSSVSFSLLILAYSAALKMSDDLKIKKILELLDTYCITKYDSNNYQNIKTFYDSLYTKKSLIEVKSKYNLAQNDSLEIVIKAELACEYFHYLYLNAKMNTSIYLYVLNKCEQYALHELNFEISDLETINKIDESILRLKIIYDISPCILDHLNNYDGFQKLHQLSINLSRKINNSKHINLGQYIENVFNRKAFLFANPAACGHYYDKAKRFFEINNIWEEYCFTLICEAGTDIVIQQYEHALISCNRVKDICKEQCIQLPLIEKLYNNEIIAAFLLAEQNAKNPKKAIRSAKEALKNLKKQGHKCSNTSQHVIMTNICSLALYCYEDKLYLKYKGKLEKLFNCQDISNIEDESIDDFYRYYFAWFEVYRMIQINEWERAQKYVGLLNGFVPAILKKQEIFWDNKIKAIQAIIDNKQKINAYDFCHHLVETKRNEQTLSKFYYRGLMLSDLQYTSYF